MNLQNYYYYFESALTPRTCDHIVEYGKQHNTEMALTGGAQRDVNAKTKSGKIKKSDKRDIHHKDGNPRNNSMKNLRARSKSKNRSRK